MWTDADRETYRDEGRRYPSDLTDGEWALLAPLVSGYDPLTGDLREMVNACLYLEKTGCPWRYLPTDFGPRPTVRTRCAHGMTGSERMGCGRRWRPC